MAPAELVLPLFVKEGLAEPRAISSLPGVVQHSRDSLRKAAATYASSSTPAWSAGRPSDARAVPITSSASITSIIALLPSRPSGVLRRSACPAVGSDASRR